MTINKQILEEQILPNVRRPGRYTNNELNAIHKDWDKTNLKIALCFPDTYEIAMSNMGIQILYHIINQDPDVLAERIFCPWNDMQAELKKHNLPIFSLESKKALADFDMLAFSVPHELTYTNVLSILDLGNIPFLSKDRTDKHPLVFAGGTACLNPEPIKDFFDFLVVGEGEEVLPQIIELAKKLKNKKELLENLSKIEGIFVPGINKTVKKRYIKDFSNASFPLNPIIPILETVHDRAAVEIMRGCPRGCRFCQAGFVNRPVRAKNKEKVLCQAQELLKNTGYNEISLLSLSSSDYPKIEQVAKELSDKIKDKKINLALPSLRVDSITGKIIKEVVAVRQSGLTIAPEAGTQRLRDVINKDLTEEQILEGAKMAVENGISSLKLYFMIGLPTETEEDLQGICDLAKKIEAIMKTKHLSASGGKRNRVTINISTFVPKVHTPFQWARQITIQETKEKLDFIKKACRRMEVRWTTPELSYLEGILSRGDEKLSQAIVEAYKNGAGLDAWSENFNLKAWDDAFIKCNINPDDYLKERVAADFSLQPLPWDYVDVLVPKELLKKEREKAYKE